MSDPSYVKKGSCFIKALIGLIVFIILLIWVYQMNLNYPI